MFRRSDAPARVHRAGLVLVVILFGLPLFAGLGNWEVANDEAIYSYAVERILETGDWLTPRSIPTDEPFFEKPPLKFWMVAAPIAAGVVPSGEAGMRLFDAAFGLLAFVYVYLLGARLAGPACGIAAALLLFAFQPLVFFAFRMNHMDGTLVLAYCAGIFHFVRWMEYTDARDRRREALIVALFFTLAFLTKFVAALFLPLVCAAALLVHPDAVARIRTAWHDWVLPAVVVIVLVSPWFVYHTLQHGSAFWTTLVVEHVYTRFADVLVPTHVAPWHAYVTETWRELGYLQMQAIVSAGIALLLWAAFRADGWLARVVLLWLLLPYTLLSFGTSKLLHYAFPFVPPLAIAGGYAFALALGAIRRLPGARLTTFARRHLSPALTGWTPGPRQRRVLIALGVLTLVIAAWTAVAGPLTIEMGDMRVFRNSSVFRPLVVAAILLSLAGASGPFRLTHTAAAVFLLLPVGGYEATLRQFGRPYEPIRSVRNCVVDVHAAEPGTAPGMLRASGNVLHHVYYYYFRHAGPWEIAEPPAHEEILRRWMQPGPVLITTAQFHEIAPRLLEPATDTPAEDTLTADAQVRRLGVFIEADVVALLPGPFEACIPRALAAGAEPLSRAEPGSNKP